MCSAKYPVGQECLFTQESDCQLPWTSILAVHSTVQLDTVQYSCTQYSTAVHSTVQLYTVQYSWTQYSTSTASSAERCLLIMWQHVCFPGVTWVGLPGALRVYYVYGTNFDDLMNHCNGTNLSLLSLWVIMIPSLMRWQLEMTISLLSGHISYNVCPEQLDSVICSGQSWE